MNRQGTTDPDTKSISAIRVFCNGLLIGAAISFILAVFVVLSQAHAAEPPPQDQQPGPSYGVIRLVSDTNPPPPRDPFSPVPRTIQQADSGLGIEAGLLHQHYVESSDGATLDAEHGSVPVMRLSWQGQYDHFGYGLGVQYATGSDRYDGALQSCTSSGCTVTPDTASTGNKIIDLSLQLEYGFSPLPHLAVLPGIFVGQHVWLRDIHGVGGYDERYSHREAGFGLGVQYDFGALVLALEGRYGTTFSPHLTSTINTVRFSLGSGAWSSVGLRATWILNPSLRLFIGDEYTGYSYGASAIVPVGGGLAAQEPHSRTQQNVIEAGLRVGL